MFISVVIVVILGTISIGDPEIIWQRAELGGRIDFFKYVLTKEELLQFGGFTLPFVSSINASMYERQTFWGVLIGGFFYWTSFNSVNQTMVQRYMSLPNLKKAKL